MNEQQDLNEIIRIANKVKNKLPKQSTLEGETIIEIGTAKEVVADVLDHSIEARNDFNILYELCRVYCKLRGIPYSSRTQEAWRRSCQYYQNTLGWWEARPEVKAGRMAKAAIWHKSWKNPNNR